MSTRSGKRIHGSFHENIAKPDDDIVHKIERKTRSRRHKENCDEVTVPKSKKRHNYVSYPADDEPIVNTDKIQTNGEIAAKTFKITLKEQDLNVSKTVNEVDSEKIVRQTRRTKKLSENIPEDIPVVEIENVKSKKKSKKNKKKKDVTEVDLNENGGLVVVPKKSKKRKGRTSDNVTGKPEVVSSDNINLNKSNGSIDSFHSAAGSPTNNIFNAEVFVKTNETFGKSPRRASKRLKADSYGDNDGEAQTQSVTFDKSSKKIKLSNHNDKLEKSKNYFRTHDEPKNNKDETLDIPDKLDEVVNTTFEKETKRRRKTSIKNSTFDKNDEVMSELNSSSKNIDTPNNLNQTFEGQNKGRRKSLRSTYDKPNTPVKDVDEMNSTYEKTNTSSEINKTFDGNINRQKSLRSTYDKTDTPPKDAKILNSTFEKDDTPLKVISTLVDNNVRRKSLRSTFDKTDTPSKNSKEQSSSFGKTNTPSKLNSTHERANGSRRMSLRFSLSVDKQAEKDSLNTTFENPKGSFNDVFDMSHNSKINSTFDKSKDSHQSTINVTFDKSKDSRQSTINTTFEKSNGSKQSTLNSTFDKETKLNSTYEKPQNEIESDTKSSIISSDSASNLTFDKSDDMSRISITSDDSRTENIINTTPVLVESSMDESQVLEPTPKDISQSSDETKLKPSVTPLKREGTFTKDSPDIISSPRVNVSLNKTPVKRMSLPSPGSTPFPFSKSSQKEKVMLNVTRSIEKSVRRSSLAEAAPRQTRVMFCSPVNNPVVVMQQKGKVIKSNLKGSNKSFVFDESVSEDVRPAGRKRSFTTSAAEEALAKRKRVGDQMHSVARLSRPRTSSVTVKLSELSTPSKNLPTPKKALTPSAKSDAKVGRTKLPNFAALHQKQFSRMESLAECQGRRARRARQLLTPTGALAIIEKSSPKGRAKTTTTESTKAAKEVPKKSDYKVLKKTDAEAPKKIALEIPKKTDTEVSDKTDTPSKAQKPFTLDSLRPGYTRFGFKMNLDVNPFSIPPKADAEPKEIKPNGLVTRQLTKPSLAGATTGRREVAKQIVMRERSFTSLSDKRKEKRTTIKGVRTNRRFELQMKLRNINS